MKIAKIPFSRNSLRNGDGLSKKLFKDMLDLMPEDAKFLGCGNDSEYFVDYMFFSSDAFVDVPEGNVIPTITPWFTRNGDLVSVTQIDMRDALQSIGVCVHKWEVHHGLMDSYMCCSACGLADRGDSWN
jgi:hypothetical protein